MVEFLKYNDFIYYRLPPQIWNVLVVCSFIYNNHFFIRIVLYIKLVHYLLNVFFDYYTITFSYSTIAVQSYDELKKIQKLMFQDTKYILYRKSIEMNVGASPTPLLSHNIKLQFNISVYYGENTLVKFLLNCIYELGITHKIFSNKNMDYFSNNQIYLK